MVCFRLVYDVRLYTRSFQTEIVDYFRQRGRSKKKETTTQKPDWIYRKNTPPTFTRRLKRPPSFLFPPSPALNFTIFFVFYSPQGRSFWSHCLRVSSPYPTQCWSSSGLCQSLGNTVAMASSAGWPRASTSGWVLLRVSSPTPASSRRSPWRPSWWLRRKKVRSLSGLRNRVFV